jgi:hypothetical protein
VGTHFPKSPLGDKCDGSAKTRDELVSPGGKNEEEDAVNDTVADASFEPLL